MDAESESLIAVMQSKSIDQVRRVARNTASGVEITLDRSQ
jgi:hypothetical protein